MFHVRSYSVRVKRRNKETVSSFRRNQQRRKVGLTLSNTSTVSAETAASDTGKKVDRSTSLTGSTGAVMVFEKVAVTTAIQATKSDTPFTTTTTTTDSVNKSCPTTPLLEIRPTEQHSSANITLKRVSTGIDESDESIDTKFNRQTKVTFSSLLANPTKR